MPEIMGNLSTGPGWHAFLEPSRYLDYALILLLATCSGTVLAYHPVYRGRPQNIEALELKKTLIIYSAVGALISVICLANPSMAFVIFGIGGLLRFRTNLGASKSTGHAIMGTLLGLCWGLDLQMVAVLATVYFWVMIYFLEKTNIMELNVGGVNIEDMGRATEAYRRAIESTGAVVCGVAKNFKKVQMTFVFKHSSKVSFESVIAAVNDIPDDLKGTPDWPS